MPEKASSLENVRHSLAHLLAAAVLEKFPGTKLGIGPVIEHGFYYDFLIPGDADRRGQAPRQARGERGQARKTNSDQRKSTLREEDLPDIEQRMRRLITEQLPFSGRAVKPAEAKKLFKDQPFKLDLIKEYAKEGRALSVYKTGSVFEDLCKGGHVKNTSEINPDAFALTHLAGAYWRGSEKNPQLTRVYGLAFSTKKELDAHRAMLEEAKKRDHRKIGAELGLFVISDLVGPGLPLYTPKGTTVLMEIKNFSRDLRKEIGFEEVQTPQINKAQLFKLSGHYDKYRADMFRAASNYTEEEYFMKPMNCPQHTQIYASVPRSYRDLPLRFADLAMLYRDEKPGELSGLTRLRSFSQDDGHCFCREDQIEEEFSRVLSAIKKAMNAYGLNYYIRLSLRDERKKSAYLGTDAIWEKSQTLLQKLLDKLKVDYRVAEGEAAFYGPKMDLIAKDSLGREWQLSTIQLDFNMPGRFGLAYTDKDGKSKTPIMVHSALVGSPERFLGVLIEHYAGAFPVWLSPVQTAVLPVGEKFAGYAARVAAALREKNIRAELADADESLGKRIREAEVQKVPYVLVVGEKEEQNATVNVRRRGDAGNNAEMKLDAFIARVTSEIVSKS